MTATMTTTYTNTGNNSKRRSARNPIVLLSTAVAVIAGGATTAAAFSVSPSSSQQQHAMTNPQGRAHVPQQQLLVLNSVPSPASFDEFAFDQDAFDRKNISRKKFGLKPLTETEFQELQVQVKKLETEQLQKAEVLRQARAVASESAGREKKENFLTKMRDSVLQDTCESNFDCESPQVCCDLGFKKMCCSSGKGIFDPQSQYERIPLRVVAGGGGPDGRVLGNDF